MSQLEEGYGVRNIKERLFLFYGKRRHPLREQTGRGNTSHHPGSA
ncbi:MAG: hypothetical protein ACLTC4_19895 [Hungatella hathewayi]